MIALDADTKADLVWWASEVYRGELGVRGFNPARELSEFGPDIDLQLARHGNASRRLREIDRNLARCNRDERGILRSAFDSRLKPRGLEAYGPYPCAILKCEAAITTHKQLRTGQEFRPWLEQLAQTAAGVRRKKERVVGRERTVASALVHKLWALTDRAVDGALRSYVGTALPSQRLPAELSLRQLARMLGKSPTALSADLEARSVPVRRRGRGTSLRIKPRDLWAAYPEAAMAVVKWTEGAPAKQ